MQSRIFGLAQILRSPQSWSRSGRPRVRAQVVPFVCASCQGRFSTSSFLRRVIHASKRQNRGPIRRAGYATEAEKAQKYYPQDLLIYDAGDLRTKWIAFWKATTLFGAGVAVFSAAVLYKQHPDQDIRPYPFIGFAVLGIIPFCVMSYLTSPFVKSIRIRLPNHATRSRDLLRRFATRAPPLTRFEFTTLRAFPFQRRTTVLLHELRALPPTWWRFANIERVKSEYLKEDEKSKGFWRKIVTVVSEPRFKFYVKEGRHYTISTGVPGVWEDIVKLIRRQSSEVGSKGKDQPQPQPGAKRPLQKTVTVPKVPVEGNIEAKKLKRQTSRSKY